MGLLPTVITDIINLTNKHTTVTFQHFIDFKQTFNNPNTFKYTQIKFQHKPGCFAVSLHFIQKLVNAWFTVHP